LRERICTRTTSIMTCTHRCSPWNAW
jgi:hypothetical protein